MHGGFVRRVAWLVTICAALLFAFPARHTNAVGAVLGGGHHGVPGSERDRQQSVRVLAVGGSAARGWMDTGWHRWRDGWSGGYLDYAFHWLSESMNRPYDLINRGIVGADAHYVSNLYPAWLDEYRPNMVVLSWGLLNDIHDGTPYPLFREEIAREIGLARERGDKVMVVTPPVTQMSFSSWRPKELRYIRDEMNVARSFHDPDIYIFNVFAQMEDYMEAHHQSIWMYRGNSWHPNHEGHVLAGILLYRDMMRAFAPVPQDGILRLNPLGRIAPEPRH